MCICGRLRPLYEGVKSINSKFVKHAQCALLRTRREMRAKTYPNVLGGRCLTRIRDPMLMGLQPSYSTSELVGYSSFSHHGVIKYMHTLWVLFKSTVLKENHSKHENLK